jgi:hypothetical protein
MLVVTLLDSVVGVGELKERCLKSTSVLLQQQGSDGEYTFAFVYFTCQMHLCVFHMLFDKRGSFIIFYSFTSQERSPAAIATSCSNSAALYDTLSKLALKFENFKSGVNNLN